jgi:hypothetical protein
MRRGPRPAKSKEAKPPAARKSPKDDGARVRDLEKRLAEALEQQTANRQDPERNLEFSLRRPAGTRHRRGNGCTPLRGVRCRDSPEARQ